MRDNTTLVGYFIIKVFDKDGRLKDFRFVKNLIVNSGKSGVADRIGDVNSIAAFEYIAIGTGTTSESASDTALESEVKRKSASKSLVTTNVTNDTLQLQATFSSSDGLSGSSAITESGVFNSSTGGTMLNRKTFSAVNCDWDAGDSLQVTWKITVS